jgi:methyl-accepting chemotaxis protein WspA
MAKLSIRQQLILFGAVLVAALVIVSGIATKRMAKSAKVFESIYEDQVVPLSQLRDVSSYYSFVIPSTLRKVKSLQLNTDQALALVEQEEASAKIEWEAYLKTYLVEDEIKLINDLKPIIQKLERTIIQVKEALRARDLEAVERLERRELPAPLELMEDTIDKLITVQETVTKSVTQQTIYEFGVVRQIYIIIVCITLGLSILLGYLILRSLNVSLAKMMVKTSQLAAGDLSVRLEAVANNELGRLARAFNQMADSLQELVSKVHRSGIQVTSSVTEIAASIREQQATATEQAATTTEIGASTKEIAATSKVLVKNMDEVAHVADSTSALAEEGREDLIRMETTMNQMMEATRGIASRLAVLSEKASKINAMVTTINKVADQTNLLSLNAAIEAEKAGEHGLGFGVVATEIRRLADQTAVATWDIEQMVKEMQSAVSSGVMGMEKFSEEVRHGVEQVGQVGDRLSKIVKSVQSLTPHFESVYQSMQEQSSGSEQINLALEQLSQTVQGTAEAMRESVVVVDQLNEASHRLQSAVSGFKVGS